MAKLRDTESNAEPSARLPSIDALRGILLLLIVGNGFGLRSEQLLNQAQWGWITSQFTHRPWAGCTLWDLLQPGFLFVAGLAMPFAYANRQAKGQLWSRQFFHAILRAGLLILIGIYLDSFKASHLVLDLRGDLQQIGLAYLLAFLVLPLGMAVHGVIVGFLLIGHTAAYVIYALTSGQELWSQAQNLGITIDHMMRFAPHPQSYVTFNVLPSTAIVMTGVLVAGLVRTGLSAGAKIFIMTGVSFAAILLGWVLAGGDGWIDFAWHPLIPMIKRIGTLTFTLTAIGWMLLVFTYFYALMEGVGLHSWALPITLVGRNALLLTVANGVFREPLVRSARLLVPNVPPLVLRLQPLLVELIVVLLFWLLCFWLYRRRIFVKV